MSGIVLNDEGSRAGFQPARRARQRSRFCCAGCAGTGRLGAWYPFGHGERARPGRSSARLAPNKRRAEVSTPWLQETRCERRGRRSLRPGRARSPLLNEYEAGPTSKGAFTLIEIMMVVAIIGLVAAMSAPMLSKFLHKEGFRKTTSDLLDVCGAARSRAILQGVTTEIVFHPKEKRCEVVGGKGGNSGGLAHSADFRDADVEMLDVNLTEYKDAEIAKVHFYPDGTSDEMTLILRSFKGGKQEYCKISLEITTALASINTNPNEWMNE